MVKPFNEFEVRRAAILKAVRSAVRLKHSLRADAELAETLPRVEAEFDQALNAGEVYSLDPASAFGEVA